MGDEIRVGVIGTGPRGRYLSTVYQQIAECRIVALCDQFEHQVQLAMAALDDPAVTCCTDHRRVLDDPAIDAVFICVAPHHNAALACEALEAGKHVLCEVPLAFTLEDCWRVVLAVERSGKTFQMAEQVRYSPFARAWRQMVREGRLGEILYAEGQYLHGMTEDRFWQDGVTGERLTPAQAKENPRAIKSRFWALTHPIWYLPHELSPLLSILDDRVVRVTGMATRTPSYKYDWLPLPDLEVALMHTEKGAILRLAAGFTIHTMIAGCHWYHLMGTRGMVETNRTAADRMKMWLPGEFMAEPAELTWSYNPHETPPEALASGHGGTDYYPMANFIKAIQEGAAPEVDVYKAAEYAAPAIVAGLSIEQDSACLPVPDFRPNARRAPRRFSNAIHPCLTQ